VCWNQSALQCVAVRNLEPSLRIGLHPCNMSQHIASLYSHTHANDRAGQFASHFKAYWRHRTNGMQLRNLVKYAPEAASHDTG